MGHSIRCVITQYDNCRNILVFNANRNHGDSSGLSLSLLFFLYLINIGSFSLSVKVKVVSEWFVSLVTCLEQSCALLRNRTEQDVRWTFNARASSSVTDVVVRKSVWSELGGPVNYHTTERDWYLWEVRWWELQMDLHTSSYTNLETGK